MELFFLYGLILFSLASLFLLYHRKLRQRQHDNNRLPPGNMGWPVVGETLEFVSKGQKDQMDKFVFNRLSKYAPSQVFKTSILGEKMVFMCGPSCNKFIFSNEYKLVQTWWPTTATKIFKTSSSISLKMRISGLYNLLKPEALQRYTPIVDTYTKFHFETEWEGKNEVKVYPLAKHYTFHLACRLFFSLDQESAQVNKLEGLFNDLTAGVYSIPINLPGTRFRKAIKASDLIRKELGCIIKQRKDDLANGKVAKSPTYDMLSHMLLTPYYEDGGFMSERDIASSIMGIIVGGHDTTSIVCTSVVKYLAEFPHIYDAVYKEQMEIARSKAQGELLTWDDIQKMKYSWNVACEVLRVAPAGPGGFKEVINDFMYGGFLIPKGWKVFWSLDSTHKNPEYFPEPEKFDPSRFEGNGPAPYTYIPFGGGPRLCPGKEYARLEILVFMHNLVKRFKWEKVLPYERTVMHITPVPAKGLPVRLHLHHE